MSIDQSAGLDASMGIDAVIKNSPPIERTTSEQEAAKVREEMRRTKAGMEKAREKLGNFCITIGSDTEGKNSKVVVLTQPVPGVTEFDKNTMNYVVVTDEGVRKVTWYPEETNNPQTRDKEQLKQKLDTFKGLLDEAIKGDGTINSGITDGLAAEGWYRGVQIGDRFRGLNLKVDQADPNEAAELASQATLKSIEAIRLQNQELRDRTAQTLEPVYTLQKQLGIEPDQVKEPEVAPRQGYRLGRFLGRLR
jgi:hypothetical protein